MPVRLGLHGSGFDEAGYARRRHGSYAKYVFVQRASIQLTYAKCVSVSALHGLQFCLVLGLSAYIPLIALVVIRWSDLRLSTQNDAD